MKFYAFLLFSLFCLTTCVSLPEPITYQNNKRNFVSHLEKVTVALTDTDQTGKMLPYCTGVWINKNQILTANHCVDDEPKEDFFFYFDLSDQGKIARVAKIVASDSQQDLALLEAIEPPYNHPYVGLTNDVWDGQHVNIVGHTIGLWWSYVEGIVSSSRISQKNETKHVQISSPAWLGNSGGGAFDDEGNLIGICSFVSTQAPMISFFIHKDKIKEFLESNRRH